MVTKDIFPLIVSERGFTSKQRKKVICGREKTNIIYTMTIYNHKSYYLIKLDSHNYCSIFKYIVHL